MKLQLDATPQELIDKGEHLVKSLGDLFRVVAPDLAETLHKAIPNKESELKFPVLRELQRQTEQEYQRQMKLMVADIGKVLDQSVEKSDSAGDLEKAGGPYIGPRGGKWADPAHTISWKSSPATSPRGRFDEILGSPPGTERFHVLPSGRFLVEVDKQESDADKRLATQTTERFGSVVTEYLGEHAPAIRIGVAPGAAENLATGTNASYDLRNKFISISTRRGHGSLYHEYGHFIDHYLGDINSIFVEDAFSSYHSGSLLGRFIAKLKATDSYESWKHARPDLSEDLQRRFFNYISAPTEMFARFFDQWIHRRLKKDGKNPTEYANQADSYQQSGGAYSTVDMDKLEQEFEPILRELSARFSLDRGRVDVYKALDKSALFIGPRGGRWADAEHTIPYKDGESTNIPIAKQVDADNKYLFDLNPHELEFTETGQSTGQYEGDASKPILVTKLDNKYLVLDGHHRTLLARKENRAVRAVVIPTGYYLKFKKEGIHQSEMKQAFVQVLRDAPDIEKAMQLFSPDFTQDIIAKEEKTYEQIKQELIGRGYLDSDFEPGGPLYGLSTNELIDLARDKRGD